MLDRETAAAIEALRKEVESHIMVHDIYVNAMRDAGQFVFNELIGTLGPAERAKITERISVMSTLYETHPESMLVGEHRAVNEQYRRGVKLVFDSVLHEYNGGENHPKDRTPKLTIIDGGKGDDA